METTDVISKQQNFELKHTLFNHYGLEGMKQKNKYPVKRWRFHFIWKIYGKELRFVCMTVSNFFYQLPALYNQRQQNAHRIYVYPNPRKTFLHVHPVHTYPMQHWIIPSCLALIIISCSLTLLLTDKWNESP